MGHHLVVTLELCRSQLGPFEVYSESTRRRLAALKASVTSYWRCHPPLLSDAGGAPVG